jgi:hypothetical protein
VVVLCTQLSGNEWWGALGWGRKRGGGLNRVTGAVYGLLDFPLTSSSGGRQQSTETRGGGGEGGWWYLGITLSGPAR